MTGELPGNSEKREHQRFPKKLSVEVHVFVLPAFPTDPGYEANGRTIDIGRGGVLLRLDKEVRDGLKVRLRFWEIPAGVRLWPMVVSGTILRMERGELPSQEGTIGAGSLLAIEFTEPLTELDVPGTE